MDVIIRRIGVYIQTAYADKSSTDLILGEERNEKRTQTKKTNRNAKKANVCLFFSPFFLLESKQTKTVRVFRCQVFDF